MCDRFGIRYPIFVFTPPAKVEANQRMNESTDPTAVEMPVGQIEGRLNEIRPVADIIAELVSGFEAAIHRLDEIAER